MAQEKKEGPFEQIGEAVGGMVGRAAGRANDAAMNAVGSLVGSVMERLGEWWTSADAERASSTFGDAEDRACREHFRSRAAGSDYDSARTHYHFGHVARHNPGYRGKSFREVEPELERAWAEAGRERFGEWPSVRDRVEFGYTYRTAGAPNPT